MSASPPSRRSGPCGIGGCEVEPGATWWIRRRPPSSCRPGWTRRGRGSRTAFPSSPEGRRYPVAAMLDRGTRRSDRWYRGRGVAILVVLITVLVVLAGALGYAYTWATGASGPQRKVEVIIPSGASGDQVATLLRSKGVIRST